MATVDSTVQIRAGTRSERIVRAESEPPVRSQQVLLEMTMKQPESTVEGGVSEPQKRRKKKKRA